MPEWQWCNECNEWHTCLLRWRPGFDPHGRQLAKNCLFKWCFSLLGIGVKKKNWTQTR